MNIEDNIITWGSHNHRKIGLISRLSHGRVFSVSLLSYELWSQGAIPGWKCTFRI
jgi:hypothetical protein